MTVEVSVFGPVRAAVDGTPVKFASLRSAHLLGYLVIHGTRPRSPAAVAEDLWPDKDPSRSRKALNTEIWRLRAAFEAVGGDAPVERDEVAVSVASDCWSDYRVFWAGTEDTITAEISDDGIDAARGVLMEGCYDDWLLIPREMAVAELSRRLTGLMEACIIADRFDRAIRAALKLIEIDPLLEAPHRIIMHAQDGLGNRAAAIRQFKKLQAMLARELQVSPLEETIALYTSIVREARDDIKLHRSQDSSAPKDVIRDLLKAENSVRRARLKLSAS